MNEMNTNGEEFSQLNEAIETLPRDINPGRELWPEIAARIEFAREHEIPALRWWQSPIVSVASLVIAVAGLTFGVTRPGAVGQLEFTDPATMQNSAGMLDPGFLADRKRLENRIEKRIAQLSPEMQKVVQQNLVSIRGSLNQLSMALAQDPGNADLQDLLIGTYEQELRVMTELTQIPEVSTRRIEL